MTDGSFDATPVHRLLGLRLVERSAVRAVVAMDVRPEHLQETGVVQGGILTALADTAAVHVLWPDLGAGRSMIGTGCSMQFLSAAQPSGGPLRAVATPLRVGRTLAVCEAEVWQDERLIAKGSFPFLFREAGT